MAKITPGALISDARGSQGTIVFSRNRSGLYTRARITPNNPNSTLQSTIRAALTYQMGIWQNTLTDSQRAAWNEYARAVARSNTLGEVHPRTGCQEFLRATINAKRYFATPTLVPPWGISITAPQNVSVAADTATHSLVTSWTTTSDPPTVRSMVSYSLPPLPGRTAPPGQWRNVSRTLASSGTSGNGYAPYSAGSNVPATGDKTWVKIYFFQYTTGAYSPEIRLGFQWT